MIESDSMNTPQRLILGISGASGVTYGIELLKMLQPTPIETHLVVSKTAHQTRDLETDVDAKTLRELADKHYNISELGASIASGSFQTMGMIVAPCSMKSLAEIAHGMSSTLLTRAADVILKERRRLVLMVRESPLNQAHIENMLKVTQMGGVIAPPVPAFYMKPNSLDEMVRHSVGRVLDLFDIDLNCFPRWEGNQKRAPLKIAEK